MKITVRVKTRARKDIVEKRDGEFIISTRAHAREGKANAAVIELLAVYFDIARSRIRILTGQTARKKQIEII